MREIKKNNGKRGLEIYENNETKKEKKEKKRKGGNKEK